MRHRITSALASARQVVVACLLIAICARADIYVANQQSGTVTTYYDSGESKNSSFITGLRAPTGIAVDNDGYVYISSENGVVGKYSPSGQPVNTSLIRIPNRIVWGLTVADGYLYTVSDGNGFSSVGKYTLEGKPISANLISGFENPVSIEVSGNELYVSDWSTGRVGKYTTSGEPVNPSLIPVVPYPNGLAVDAKGILFVSAANSLGKYKTDGSVISRSLVSEGYYNTGSGLAIDSDGSLLVANNYGGEGGNVIRKYSQSGELLDAEFISGLSNPVDIAIVIPEPSPLVLLLFFAGTFLVTRLRIAAFRSAGRLWLFV